jgi:thiamine biosynthesis lipoprotein
MMAFTTLVALLSPVVVLREESSVCVTRGAWWCALLLLLLVGCQSQPARTETLQPVTRVQPHLGTFVSITVFAEPQIAQAAINAAFEEFRAVDRLLSIHRNDSKLARANKGEAINPELKWILNQALAISKETKGAFDPTIRPLADMWGFIKKEGYRLPSADELRPVLSRVDYRKVNIKNNQLEFGVKGMSIDPGGFGKGYAVDCAIGALKKAGIKNAMIKAGGDLRVIGLPHGKTHWTVFIEDPEKKGNRLPVHLRGGAMSTSGNYENFFIEKGKSYGHLLDPRTGHPIQGIGSCTLVAPTCMESDAYATAACGGHQRTTPYPLNRMSGPRIE